MFFDASQTGAALGAVAPGKAPGLSKEPSQHLNQQQFGKKAGPAEAEGGAAGAAGAEAGAGAAEGAAAAGGAEAGAAAGGASLAELAPLLLI
jgi:hypothetical protein